MSHYLSQTAPQVLLNAQTASGTAGILLIEGLCARATVSLTGTGTTSSGVITIEEAYYSPSTSPYAGTWSLLANVNASDLTGGVQKVIHVTGSVWALRVRISTVIGGGGTITAVAWGN